jgi:hypothetical protein
VHLPPVVPGAAATYATTPGRFETSVSPRGIRTVLGAADETPLAGPLASATNMVRSAATDISRVSGPRDASNRRGCYGEETPEDSPL